MFRVNKNTRKTSFDVHSTKVRFSIRIFSVKVTKSAVFGGFGHIY